MSNKRDIASGEMPSVTLYHNGFPIGEVNGKVQKCKNSGGFYTLGLIPGATKIQVNYKPNFIHRLFMKVCLGFNWEDSH